MASTLVLGLDLGNTTCSVAVYRAGVVEVVANPEGSRVTPACIAFTEVETLLGEPARAQLARNVANTVVDGLRLLGREYDDDDFQKELASWRFKVSKGKDGAPLVEVKLKGEAKSFTAPRLLALLLSKLRADADASTGETVKEAVVAVPAAFSEQQTAALKEAAQTGAIRVKLMLSAPLCVALLFGQTIGREATATAAAAAAAAASTPPPPPPPPQQLLVVDIGGSSSFAAVVERAVVLPTVADAEATPAAAEGSLAARTATDEYTVRACVLERGLGGNAVDVKLRAHVCKEIRRRQRVDLSDNSRAMSRLLAACQTAKHSLTLSAQATIAVEADGADYFANVSRAALEELTVSTATGAAALAARALAASGLAPSKVDALLLSGGGARMPRVQAALSALCPDVPMHFSATSEESTVRGAAHAGAMLRPLTATDAPSEQRTAALSGRARLPRALGLVTAAGHVAKLAEAHAAVPLTRAARLAPPAPSALPILLQLVELPPPAASALSAVAAEGTEAAAAAAAPEVSAADCRIVASLAVRELPDGVVSLLVRVSLDTERHLELICEAALGGDAEEGEGGGSLRTVSLASVKA